MSDRFKFRFWNKLGKAYENTYDLKCCEHLDYVVPEQCTGLKDKNSKLIYEGDIVKIYAKNRYAYGIYQIKYDCDDCEYDMLDKEGDFIYQLQNDKTKYIEVIGNIHENKELLDE